MRKYSWVILAMIMSASSLAEAQNAPATPTQATPTGPVTAQGALGGGTAPQVNTNNVQSPAGQTFDPATRLFSSTHPPIADPNAPQAAPVITPEEQAEMDRQKQLAEIQQKRADAKAKMEKARAEEKKREQAQKDADAKRMAALKEAREARLKEMKDNREELAKLLQEEKDARKAYQDAKKNATGAGGTQTIDDDFRKAEKDRQKKIQELRHPKYKPITSQSVNGTGNNTTSGSTGTSTALPGTTTTGNGPNATTH